MLVLLHRDFWPCLKIKYYPKLVLLSGNFLVLVAYADFELWKRMMSLRRTRQFLAYVEALAAVRGHADVPIPLFTVLLLGQPKSVTGR
jgi:hypothetical protein